MNVIALSETSAGLAELVGGKATGLGEMIRIGERVPDGFCLTTAAHRRGGIPQAEVVAAYRALGGGPVAVRSSATAEDLPHRPPRTSSPERSWSPRPPIPAGRRCS